MSNEQTPPQEDTAVGMEVDSDFAQPESLTPPVDEAAIVPATSPTPEAVPNENVDTDVGLPADDEGGLAVDPPATAEELATAENVELLAVFLRQGVNLNAELIKGMDPSRPLDPRRAWREGESLFIVPATAEEFNNLVINTRRLDPTQSESGARWRSAVGLGRELMPRADTGLAALMRQDSLWRQKVQVDGEGSTEIAAGRPSAGERRGDAPLVGEEALQHMQTILGTGQIVRIPLWHSGIWVNFKAPTEAQLLELDRRIANEKIDLGRATQGLAYSNMSVYHNAYLFNFALSMIFDCSISGYTIDRLKEKILLTDLPLLLWGLLCTIYPNGYRYHRPCVVDPSACQHVVEALLDISKLCWTDNKALDNSQRNHMVRKATKFTDIELTNYLAKHRYNGMGNLLVKEVNGNKTYVELRVPTLADYEQSGYSWVEGIVASTDQAFGSQLAGDDRNEYILDQARATALRQYAHWIKRINTESADGTQRYIEDRNTIEQLISQLTGDQEVLTNFMNGVQKYINEATISQIAIPSYKCPACQKDQQTDEEAKHPHLIPLDTGTIFLPFSASAPACCWVRRPCNRRLRRGGARVAPLVRTNQSSRPRAGTSVDGGDEGIGQEEAQQYRNAAVAA
ncbi:hypothetical protein [Xanthomonas phage RTH11]|nr:hypothetical protein [Xanthomonas phage RTH11]